MERATEAQLVAIFGDPTTHNPYAFDLVWSSSDLHSSKSAVTWEPGSPGCILERLAIELRRLSSV
jgi:hypothetical protein